MAKGIGSSVEWYEVDQILSGYDLHSKMRDEMYYSVWCGAVPKFVYDGGDVAEGRDLLAQNLSAWAANGNTSTYTLRFHPSLDKNGDITNASLVNGSGNFRLNEPDYVRNVRAVAQVTAAPPINAETDKKLDLLIQLVAQQNERLNALEEEPEFIVEDDEEEEEEEDKELTRMVSGVQKIETVINESPLLSEMVSMLRIGVKSFARKYGVIEEPNYPKYNTVSGMNETTAQQQETTETRGNKSFGELFKELVAQFPELPNMVAKMHYLMENEPNDFLYIKKKLIEGLNNA
jgi:hypothetical protein